MSMLHLNRPYRIFIPFVPSPLSILILIPILILILFPSSALSQSHSAPVFLNDEGNLEYTPDSLGNRIPDFSYCGYKAGEQEIPFVPVKVVVPVPAGDATPILQQAIDYMAALPRDENGFRGSILLEQGTYHLKGRLLIGASGIVLRGSGNGPDETVLVAGGTDRGTLIRIAGIDDREKGQEAMVADPYVPVNATRLKLGPGHPLKSGDRVWVRRPTTAGWIRELGMESFGGETGWLGWKGGNNDILWDRTVAFADETSVTLDVPVTTALDTAFGGGFVSLYSWKGRLSCIGIENMRCRSAFNPDNPKDEDHAWMAITIENAEDCWVRRVIFEHFAGSAVAVYETAKQVTVEDCISLHPVSEIGGQRRITFFTAGQQTLFQRCYAENGCHDFAVGHFAPGPNAFVQCESHLPFYFSGTIDRWASGVLFDNVIIDGHALSLKNRRADGQGAGWTAANSVIWQCSASRIECYSPPTAVNRAFGTWGQFSGNGTWYESDSHIKPRSLYYAQLSQRIGEEALKRAFFLPLRFESTSSPAPDQALAMTLESAESHVQLREWIEQADQRAPIPAGAENADRWTPGSPDVNAGKIPPAKETTIRNGWITIEDAVITGQTRGVQWWRGTTRPDDILKAGPHLTRFVPGRTGTGYTDDLEELTDQMLQKHVVAVNHNYGLWYDRRRDDHERIRRMDGDVWPPFYEQPFARSGQGTAWDGLSLYDLTKPNPWYWMRLKSFADLADEKGLVLIHQHYFQHNILEAGAHWADFPWRTANNVNNTGFPEPPPYAGEKRIFMAEQFYDTSHTVRKEIHRQYIRQCLAAFAGNANVIQSISEEFTGPLHFMNFWLDVIIGWEKETGENAKVALSATKDVQDAVLEDPLRAKAIEIIDIRYWHYRDDLTLYAPEGGKNLAPRQHARLVSPGNVSFESVVKAVSEYRLKYPDKAVIYSAPLTKNLQWAVFMAGGSMADIPVVQDPAFYTDAATMKPGISVKKQQGIYTLTDLQGKKIVFCSGGSLPEIDLPETRKAVLIVWIDPANGKILKTQKQMQGGKTYKIELPKTGDVILWIKDQ